MTDAPLTTAELAELEHAAVAAKLDVHFAALLDLIAEVRQHRALIATPTLCGWPQPVAYHDQRAGRLMVEWEPLTADGDALSPGDAEALGAALIRAALAARARAGRDGGDE